MSAPAPQPLNAWDKVQLARHPRRPRTLDFVQRLCSSFFELRGDRCFADDQALIGGVGRTAVGPVMVLGHQKGRNTRENVRRNFGMPHPEGFRKAQRLMLHAEKFRMPLICFLDTPGAHPSVGAEERGQAMAIAQSMFTMTGLRVPIVAIVIGEGCSGGALAVGVADRLLMLEHAFYAVASPEASASILWRDAGRAAEAANLMQITAQDLHACGMVDQIVPEPPGGAHAELAQAIESANAAILSQLDALQRQDWQSIVWQRCARYRAIGRHATHQQRQLGAAELLPA